MGSWNSGEFPQSTRQIAQFTPPGSRHHLVHGEVHRMQNVSENLVAHRRKKSKIAVGHPFEACAGASARDFSGMNGGMLPQPADSVTFFLKRLGISEGRGRNAFLAVMENVDIAGVTGRGAVWRCRSRYIALGVPMRSQKAENAY
jgi:hypothetical protein